MTIINTLNMTVVDLSQEVILAIKSLGENPSKEAVQAVLARLKNRHADAASQYQSNIKDTPQATLMHGVTDTAQNIETIGLTTGETRLQFGAQAAAAIFIVPTTQASPTVILYAGGKAMIKGDKARAPQDQLAIYPPNSAALAHIAAYHARPAALQCLSDIPDALANTKIIGR